MTSVKLTITIPQELQNRINKHRKGVMEINISRICTNAIDKELKKIEGN